ncbi:hypothetical protein Peur_012498 [Populus x canadensis]
MVAGVAKQGWKGAVHDTKSSQSLVKKSEPVRRPLLILSLHCSQPVYLPTRMYLLGGSEQARRPLLVADQEDPHYHHQCSSNGGVDGNSSATGFLAFSTIVAATCSFTSGYRVRTLALPQSSLNF